MHDAMSDTDTQISPAAANDASDASDGSNARETLLQTASEIMREGDMVDISLSELSLRSGLNSALVKYYFGNKEGLLLALLERNMRSIVNSVDALMAKSMPPQDKLRIHIGAVINTYYDYPYLNRLLMRLVRDCSPDRAQMIAEQYLTPLSRAYDVLIREGIAQGVFRDVDPALFYFTVTGAADRFFAARQVLRHCFDQDTLTEELRDRYRVHTIDIIMHGILVDSPD